VKADASGRPRFSDQDRRFMRLALRVAERGRGTTRPNPVVGAVLVKNGRVLATGYHERAGGPHAELVALDAAGGRAPGATMYVTLEPCCHTGRTGPCTDTLLGAGLARVVVGCVDENPRVAGQGLARLRRAGLRVDLGCLEEACHAANRAFFVWIRHRRPLVTLKAAATLDGFIAPAVHKRGTITWITGEPARQQAHTLRAGHDAILVGAGTVHSDDPRLTVRLPGTRASILRVVLDGQLRTPVRARLLSTRQGPPPLIIGARPATAAERRQQERRQRALAAAGAEVSLLPAGRDRRVPIARVLRALAGRGVQSLLVEGGSQIHQAFISARLVDRVAFFFAPRLQGGGVPLAAGGRGLPWSQPLQLGPVRVQQFSGDILITADVLSVGKSRQMRH
jgi:diaminohydroxyphosphoribosylaminopyrimidine deaminase / 5-amino-6-(5-phosphoribosylamino)uracil reductase